MGLFDWGDALTLRLWLNVVRAYDLDQELVRREGRRSDRSQGEKLKIERTRWLEEHHAERSFPCGIVLMPDPTWPMPKPPAVPEAPASRPSASQPSGAPGSTPPTPVPRLELELAAPLLPMQVIAAVLPTDAVFVLEEAEGDDVKEVGRLPRSAILGIDVIDERGDHVPEPIHETIEQPQVVFTLIRWSNEGSPDEDRFLFRSPWLAWNAGRKLLEARRG